MFMASAWVEAEFETIFREHFVRLLRVTRRVLHSDAEADEVCADTFLKLYRSGPGVLSGGAVGAWLYRVATRASIDRLRKNSRRPEQELDAEAATSADDAKRCRNPYSDFALHRITLKLSSVLTPSMTSAVCHSGAYC